MDKELRLRKAVSAVRQNRMGVRVAAKEFDVPKSTLQDHVKNVKMNDRPGPIRLLSATEEEALKNYLLYMSSQGFALTRNMTRCFVLEMIRRAGRQYSYQINTDRGPSDDWFRKFLGRHPQLNERSSENMDAARARMSNETVIMKFFDFFENVVTQHNLKDRPHQLFNCDETGWSGKEKPKTKVIGPRGGHCFRKKTISSDHVTAHLCVCADGRFLPSMVIFQGSIPAATLGGGMPESWLYAASENGYMDHQLFERWFVRAFIPNCGRERPVILVMDNHGSHISLPVVEKARENGVVLVGFPAHTTHILQPLDVKLISPLKARFLKLATTLGFISPHRTLGRSDYPILLRYAIEQTTPASIKESFAATGLLPLNRDAIDKTQLVPASFNASSDNTIAEQPIRTCGECGSFLVNPLVRQGLVPQSMADILVPPAVRSSQDKRKKRVVLEGRVISGDDMYRQLKEKEQAEREKLERQLMREKEREEKRVEKKKAEEERAEKKKKREAARERKMEEQRAKEDQRRMKRNQKRLREDGERQEDRQDGRLASKIYTCGVCGVRGRVSDERNGVFWVGCDEEMCCKWYHLECLSESEREYVRESLEDESEWFCRLCKPWLYEEE